MAQAQQGAVSAADLILMMDALGVWQLRAQSLGQGGSNESTTLAYEALEAMAKIMGDGTTTRPGLANSGVQQAILSGLQFMVRGSRWEWESSIYLRGLMTNIEQQITSVLPAGKDLQAGGRLMLDAYLTRLNATNTGAPAKPTGTPVLTATTGGAIPSVASGSAPRFCYTFVGASDDLESLPSAEATQVALSGANNAYAVTGIQNPIPAGVTKIALYRGVAGGSSGTYYWIRDVAVTAGSAPPAITIGEADLSLRKDWSPPSFAQCLMTPEDALAYALAFVIFPNSPIDAQSTLSVPLGRMLSPANVALGLLTPSTTRLGLGNPLSSGQFGQWVGGTGYTAGTIQSVNDVDEGLQGFLGAGNGIRLRVTSALNNNASVSNVAYTYVDAANPTTPQSATAAGPFTLNLGVDQTVDVTITAGRIVKSVTALTVATATTGTFIVEAKALR